MRNCFVYIKETFYCLTELNCFDFPSLSCKCTLSMNKLKFNRFGRYKMGHAQLFRVQKRKVLFFFTQPRCFDFPWLSCKGTLTMNKVKFKISHLIGLYKIGHAQLFHVHRRKTLYFTWHSWNTLSFLRSHANTLLVWLNWCSILL